MKNPNNPSLVRGQYDYWHWGPDEALDVTPGNYPSGKAYAFTSISNSFQDVEGWLSGLTNGLRAWVGCYFNATREDSYDIQAQLGVNIAGDQKLAPSRTGRSRRGPPGKRYAFLTEPVSDWFVGGLVAQSLEPWHPPGVQTSQTLHSAVDFYYNLGALLNFYSHTLSTGLGRRRPAGAGLHHLQPEHQPAPADLVGQCGERLSMVAAAIQRANECQLHQPTATSRSQPFPSRGQATRTPPVELLLPGSGSAFGLQVLTNGVLAGGD